jgi:hypothetical protein
LHGGILQWACEALRSYKEVVLAAGSQDGTDLLWGGESFRSDKEVVITGFKNSHLCITYAADYFRNDVCILEQNLETICHTTAEFQSNNKEFLVSAICANPNLLEWVTDSFRQDRDAVLCAYLQNSAVAARFGNYTLSDW